MSDVLGNNGVGLFSTGNKRFSECLGALRNNSRFVAEDMTPPTHSAMECERVGVRASL